MFRDYRSFRFYDINEAMCSLGFLGIVDGTNLERVKNDLTRSAGVHDWPIAMCCDKFLIVQESSLMV